MERTDLPTLISELVETIDYLVEAVLQFDDADLDRMVEEDDGFGRRSMTLRQHFYAAIDEFIGHRGQMVCARINAEWEKHTGERHWRVEDEDDPAYVQCAKGRPPLTMKDGYGRSAASHIAGEVYLRGHEVIADLIGIDEALTEKSPRDGEWSAKDVVRHLIGFKAYFQSKMDRLAPPATG